MSPKEPKIVDLSVKEGGFPIAHHWTLDQVSDLAVDLQRAKIQYLEVCHGCGIGGLRRGFPGRHSDLEMLKAARRAAPGLTFTIYIDSVQQSIAELELVSDHFEIGKVGVNAGEPSKVTEHLRRLKVLKKQAFVQLLRIHSLPPDRVANAAAQLQDEGADGIYLVDSFGSMDGEEVRAYFEAVAAKTTLPLGFQGRNNTQRAVSNALTAWKAGAEWIDVSLLGVGRDAGITNATNFISLLQRQGFAAEIDNYELANATWFGLYPMVQKIPAVGYLDLLIAKYRIDLYPKEYLNSFGSVLEMSPEKILQELKNRNPGLVEVTEAAMRDLLEKEKLRYEVVMEYLRTGKLPILQNQTPGEDHAHS